MFTESPAPGTPAGVQSAAFDQLSDPSFQSLVTASPFPATSNKQTTASPTIKVRHMTMPSRKKGNKTRSYPLRRRIPQTGRRKICPRHHDSQQKDLESRDRRSRNSCPTWVAPIIG